MYFLKVPALKKLLASGDEHNTSTGSSDLLKISIISLGKFRYPLDILIGNFSLIELVKTFSNTSF